MMDAPHLPCTLDCAGSMEIVPTSPQSRFSAQRPEANSGRVSLTSRFSSSSGPYFVDSLRKSSALRNGRVVDQRSHVVVLKNAPWLVPLDCTMEPTTSVTNQ
jgi:hypothetical protein